MVGPPLPTGRYKFYNSHNRSASAVARNAEKEQAQRCFDVNGAPHVLKITRVLVCQAPSGAVCDGRLQDVRPA
ncbi:hypothetical protein RRG08_000462 [Elysia crispata]|uniref:Uncharacterized protein n=1 Tax=Elysia crispata TaxID=231223 RepID=A0AAE0YCY5_9GAST|nr:hypothetical protein RRG08_000462 [Elysia crispata]